MGNASGVRFWRAIRPVDPESRIVTGSSGPQDPEIQDQSGHRSLAKRGHSVLLTFCFRSEPICRLVSALPARPGRNDGKVGLELGSQGSDGERPGGEPSGSEGSSYATPLAEAVAFDLAEACSTDSTDDTTSTSYAIERGAITGDVHPCF